MVLISDTERMYFFPHTSPLQLSIVCCKKYHNMDYFLTLPLVVTASLDTLSVFCIGGKSAGFLCSLPLQVPIQGGR